ncbi:Low-density lipoprotein receptor domain class A [Dictyocaulus viviparus]|uniref:Low-density lipoprotein receptor domain class A n=1 Tax=Dictyocaulus viviparus TaxID=29172 RepID=A0A0D8XW46_DICVI|nr:Low-density lipoprotein receptor domain class A [Dictyocaulus viviparus]
MQNEGQDPIVDSKFFNCHIVSKCLYNNGGCEQLCFPGACSDFQKCDDIAPKCGCADEFLVDKTDSRRCIINPVVGIGGCKPSQFMCKHTEVCIENEKVCDGKWDCYDGSDEDNRELKAENAYWFRIGYIIAQFKNVRMQLCITVRHRMFIELTRQQMILKTRNVSCSKTEFRCDSLTCIPNHLVCDGRSDCEDRSDESWARERRTSLFTSKIIRIEKQLTDRTKGCVNDTFICAPIKQCLPNSWRCDGRIDCPDRSDENNCETRDCNADHFQCLTGQCIPLDWACDGRRNCRDGSDELHCHEGCRIGREFRCDPSSTCLDISLKCDGIIDCENGSDERDCLNIMHSPEGCRIGREFRCDPSSTCLDISLKCDGIIDCENGSDERDCLNISSTQHCRKLNEFLCKREQRCIRRSAVCDGIDDCLDGEDERKCKGNKCAAGLFACRNRDECVASHLECDGVADCTDGTFNTKIVEARCKAPDITCRTFTGIVCLPAVKICDGTPDCSDAKDEEFCGHEQQRSCLEKDCEDVCFVQPYGNSYTTYMWLHIKSYAYGVMDDLVKVL